MGTYKIVRNGGIGEIEEKRSRFIGEIRAVTTEEEARAMIDEIRKKHYAARHHCYAYLCPETEDQREIQRSSDDGEPSGTAGRPILSVLQGAGLSSGACIVVTRYFGGTLLGTGGLIRAYTAAAKAAIEAADIAELQEMRTETYVIEYSELDKLKYKLKELGAVISDIQYTDKVTLTAEIPV